MSTPDEEPILNSPFEEPKRYWEIDHRSQEATDERKDGRRPAGNYLSVPNPVRMRGQRELDLNVPSGGQEQEEPYRTINNIRGFVTNWRESNYRGCSDCSKALLQWWADPHDRELRPYFAQLNAMETLIWLLEAGQVHDPTNWSTVQDHLLKANRKWNRAIRRISTKMATGAGKTLVMQMLIAFLACRHHGQVDVIAITPGLTVRDRLLELQPTTKGGGGGRDGQRAYDALVPPSLRHYLNGVRVSVINYQALATGSGASSVGKKLTQQARRLLRISEDRTDPHAGLKRILKHQGDRPLYVINDEAHHCYEPRPRQRVAGNEGEIQHREKNSGVWFQGVRWLHERERDNNRELTVFDFSATPMFLAKPNDLEQPSELFPWTVSDYPLVEAIEAGLTKIPKVPTSDDTPETIPTYRNLYEVTDVQNLDHRSMPIPVQKAITHMVHDYQAEKEARQPPDVVMDLDQNTFMPPVMIIVANSITSAQALYRYIAGYKDGNGKWRAGQIQEFANIRREGEAPGPPSECPTLLVHSKDGDAGDEITEGANLHMPPGKKLSKKQQKAYIRKLFNTIGQPNREGAHIRLVISVGMLTEGWDAKTVTHILGYRAFGTQLLCEQVVGRGLRRTGLERISESGFRVPERVQVLGVPFSFIKRSGNGDTGPVDPIPTYAVYSVPSKAQYAIHFPAITGYFIPTGGTDWVLDPNRVQPYIIHGKGSPIRTEVEGVMGKSDVMDDFQLNKAEVILQMARRLHQATEDQNWTRGTGILMHNAVNAIKDWLQHPKVNFAPRTPFAALLEDDGVIDQIRSCCTAEDVDTTPQARFGRTGDSTQVVWRDTSGIFFQSNKPLFVIPTKSHTNIAPLDSMPERVVAETLDNHPLVAAWIRNEGLEFEVPYIDPATGTRRMFWPDFIAKLKSQDGDRPVQLIIEFKGQMSPTEAAKRFYTKNYWIPAANRIKDDQSATWYLAWLENPQTIAAELDAKITTCVQLVNKHP